MSEEATWRPFVDAACEATGVDPARVDIDTILLLTREVAHAGARPMAPVTAYILGLAMGANPDADPAELPRRLEWVVQERTLPPASSAPPAPPASPAPSASPAPPRSLA